MFEPVEAVPAQPPTTGLLATALTPRDNARWQQGMVWRPERCPTAQGFPGLCAPELRFNAALGAGDDGLAYYVPQAFRVSDLCSARPGDLDTQRVVRQAKAVASYMIARELQDGTTTRSRPHDIPNNNLTGQVNAYLASPLAQVEAGTYDLKAGLGLVEELARRDALGMDVVIHMPLSWAVLLGDSLTRSGNLLFTPTGARVAADAGYTGTGVLSAGTSEVHTITLAVGVTGGTWVLSYGGDPTTDLPWNATAAQVQAAVLALPDVNTGDVTVTGPAGGPWVLTWDNELGNVTAPTVDGTNLTGGADPDVSIATTTPGVAPAPAAGAFLYATGPVEVRTEMDTPRTILDHRTNRSLVTVDTLFAATFDPCNLHAVRITPPVAS